MNDQVLLCKVLKIILGSRFYGSLGCLVCQLILPKVRDKFNLKNQLYFKCVFIANRIRNTVDVIPWCWSVGDKTDLFHSAFGQPFRKAKTIVSGNELIWQSRGGKTGSWLTDQVYIVQPCCLFKTLPWAACFTYGEAMAYPGVNLALEKVVNLLLSRAVFCCLFVRFGRSQKESD